MITRAILLLFFLSCLNITHAQNFHAHILAGVATSQVSGDQLAGFNKAGLIGGAGVDIALSKKTELGFEIYYIQKGSLKQTNIEKEDYEYYRLRLNYLEIPLILRYRINKKLSIELGPSIGTLISFSEENQDGELIGQPSFSKFDISIWGGLVYHFTDNWGMNFRGSQSVVPIREHKGGSTDRLNKGQYNSVLYFTLFYRFGKKTGSNE